MLSIYIYIFKQSTKNPPFCIEQMSEHNIHLCGVFNNTLIEIPARGDNAG